MSDVTITVRGENEARVAPERATVSVTVRTEGPERAAVVDRVMRLAEPVRASIAERKESGAVADWTSKRLAVRAERPWNNEGKRLALVYHATIDFSATFTEASELSIWVSDISAWDGVEIGWVNWDLTPETRARVEREVASSAVGVAVARAEAYASALNLSTVTPLEIADVGLISKAQPQRAPQMMQARGMAFAVSDSAPTMEYEPDEIIVSAAVEARFTAS
ncbi:neuraminidase [Microbacterium sp. CH12i]|uniref:SIMPL domain-containing protein n=1 Tax=Microbacterium sp. CH12i TaxID=1479651 RepID=UPI000461F331|nr:SIMPL domain-containing protein [Microbacterium sp. CH12i]KDA05793.1 neuraminidase [Microbacterium sp. CH12i]